MASNSFFIGGTDLHGVTLARADERDAPNTFAALIDEVRSRCGDDVAALFAEPVRGTSRTSGQPNLAWYGTEAGSPFPLGRLEGAARRAAADLLRQRLQRFTVLLADPRNGAAFAAWLHVLGPDSLVVVSGQPVIRDWGMLPDAVAASADGRERHFRDTLGPFLPAMPIPPFNSGEAQAFAAAVGRHAAREVARAIPVEAAQPAASSAAPMMAAATRAGPGTARPWLAPLVAAAIAAAVLAVLAFGNVLRYPLREVGPTGAVIEAQRQTNEALRERLARLRATPVAVCRADPGVPALPGAPPAPGREAAPLLPPAPERTRVETADPQTRQPEQSTLGALLEKATVLVLNKDSLGSGFFVSDRFIVTNHHVVGDAREVKVASRALGGVVAAKVVAVGEGEERGTQDIAVLEIAPKPGTAALAIGVAPARLDAVTASGFPGAVLETIEAQSSRGLPEANFTQGIVTSHQLQQPGSISTIIHTAQIGHGNSGGPLVDAGGCAVGINSWLSPDAMDDMIFSTFFQALDASELRRFLQGHGIGFNASDGSCRPVVTAEAAPPAGQPPPGQIQPAPGQAQPAQGQAPGQPAIPAPAGAAPAAPASPAPRKAP